MKKYFVLPLIVFVIISCRTSNLPENEYDTDLSITHLDISIKTNFENNEVDTNVIASVENFSGNEVNEAQFWICPGMNDPDLSADVSHIYHIDGKRKRELEFTIRTVEDSFNKGYEWEIYSVSFERSMKPGEEFDLEFKYTMRGKPDHSSTPIWISKEGLKELFLRGDFIWCPSLYVQIKPGVFPKLYEPDWRLRLEYPSEYVV